MVLIAACAMVTGATTLFYQKTALCQLAIPRQNLGNDSQCNGCA